MRRFRSPVKEVISAQLNLDYVRSAADIEICEDLVDIARGVLRKDLKLSWNDSKEDAYTDGFNISVPEHHIKRRLILKHELGHIYFDSNLTLRLAFANKLVDKVVPLAVERDYLVQSVCYFINVLDDVRVNSLWGEVWPGDGVRMKRYFVDKVGAETKKSLSKGLQETGTVSLGNYLILKALQQSLTCEWNRLDDKIESAVRDVRLQTFEGLLLVVRDLMVALVEELEKEDKKLEQSFGSDIQFREDAGTSAERSRGLDSYDCSVDFEEAKALLDVEDSEDFLEDQQDQIFNKLEEIQEAMDSLKSDPSKVKNLGYRVRNYYPPPGDLGIPTWTPEMIREAERWSALFRSITGAKVEDISREGERLSHYDYLLARLSRTSLPFYYSESTGIGFEATILVDMSGSMQSCFDQVNRLFLVLHKALSLPFVKINVIGFTGGPNHLVLVNFGESPSSLLVKGSIPVWGLTPTHRALEQVHRNLRRTTNEKHLFVITDGVPSGGVTAQAHVAHNRKCLQDEGVNVQALVIGNSCSWAMTDDHLDSMFGASHWMRAEEEDIYKKSFEFLSSVFVRFVRRVF